MILLASCTTNRPGRVADWSCRIPLSSPAGAASDEGIDNHGPDTLSFALGHADAQIVFVFHHLEQPSPAAKASGGGRPAELAKDPPNESLAATG
jgi:hypothetical protein